MAAWDYRCELGHVTEVRGDAGEGPPPSVPCSELVARPEGAPATRRPWPERVTCGLPAERVWRGQRFGVTRRFDRGEGL